MGAHKNWISQGLVGELAVVVADLRVNGKRRRRPAPTNVSKANRGFGQISAEGAEICMRSCYSLKVFAESIRFERAGIAC